MGAAFASASAGVHEIDVALDCDTIVVCALLPNCALSVCRNDEDAGDKLIVATLPSVMLPTDGVVLRGIVGSVTVMEPLTVPKEDAMLKSPLNESVNWLVPSAL